MKTSQWPMALSASTTSLVAETIILLRAVNLHFIADARCLCKTFVASLSRLLSPPRSFLCLYLYITLIPNQSAAHTNQTYTHKAETFVSWKDTRGRPQRPGSRHAFRAAARTCNAFLASVLCNGSQAAFARIIHL